LAGGLLTAIVKREWGSVRRFQTTEAIASITPAFPDPVCVFGCAKLMVVKGGRAVHGLDRKADGGIHGRRVKTFQLD